MTNAIKLDDISKWALATYNKTMNSTGSGHFNQMMPTSKSANFMPKGRTKYTAAIDKYDRLNRKDTMAKEFQNELIAIKTIDELQIDHSQVMNMKKGDLSIIKGEVYRCYPIAPHLREVPLIVKRLECVDRKIYDLKIYESDTFMRFRSHPNIVSLYSYWAEPSNSKYVYKTLVQLYEEGICGDMLRTVVLNAVRPNSRLVQKYICDIAKGLVEIHNSNIVHGAVKPSNIYIGNQGAMLGEFKKVELDSARQTHQLFSKLLIGKAIPKTLVYWAPELLKLESYDFRVDLWSLGVTIYQIVTGEHPFTVTHEEKFRDDILNGTVDWSRLESAPRIKTIVSNLLKVSPDQRWSAQQVLNYCQNDFAIDLQRTWRGFYQRKEFKRQCRALVKIQASVKGWLTRIHYQRDRIICRENAAIMIQKTFRSHARRKKFVKQRKALMVCQANVLCRQMKRAYLKSKLDVTNAQAYLRRYLAVTWFKRIKAKKAELEAHMETIGEEIAKYNIGAQIFKNHFSNHTISGPLKYLESFEEFEMTKAKTYGIEKSVIPRVSQIQTEINKLTEEKMGLMKKLEEQQKKNQSQDKDEEELKKVLGDKFTDYKPMIEDVKKNLKRIAELSKKSNALDIKMQHEYKYSKWDQIHEPYNVVENVLKPDESVYRALNPSFDFTLHNGSSCFISEVIIHPGDVGPASVEIYVSNAADKWNFVRDFKCTRDNEQRFTLPGEQIAKYLRVKCVNNIRGGNIVSIKFVQIRGISKDL